MVGSSSLGMDVITTRGLTDCKLLPIPPHRRTSSLLRPGSGTCRSSEAHGALQFDRDLLARLRRVDHRTPAERPLRTLRARRNTYRLVNQIEQEEGMDASLESLSA